jgi:aspartate/methionine/tyrosine aminotransferase
LTEKDKPSAVCSALKPYGTSIFTEMSALSNRAGAVNLSQGFPDFDGPKEIAETAAEAILKGPNQYVPSMGIEPLRTAVAAKMRRFYRVDVDSDREITVTSGASEGLAASLLGLLDPGDEVILLEPCYDLYPPVIARAGATPVFVSLEQPDFALNRGALASAFGPRTKAVVINNPQNPCGKVFSREELEFVGRLCQEHNALAIGDEVYEHLVYDNRAHVTLLDIPSLRDRAIVVSSTAKTFSMTGWKVGYVIAAPHLTEAIRMSHQFLTFCTAGAFQAAMAVGIGMDDSYYESLLESYRQKRELLCNGLSDLGFDVLRPEGTYYASVDIGSLEFEDDLAFCRYLTEKVGVAAIPSSFFWDKRRGGRNLVRFCFCKKDGTLAMAIERLKRWKR